MEITGGRVVSIRPAKGVRDYSTTGIFMKGNHDSEPILEKARFFEQ